MMNDTNFISGIVKILEIPKQKIISKNIFMSTFRVQFPQLRKNTIVSLKVWGELVSDIGKYYKVDDYILIEGYLSIKSDLDKNKKIKLQGKKTIEITVLKMYPFLLE